MGLLGYTHMGFIKKQKPFLTNHMKPLGLPHKDPLTIITSLKVEIIVNWSPKNLFWVPPQVLTSQLDRGLILQV